jgi:hypothetical protein
MRDLLEPLGEAITTPLHWNKEQKLLSFCLLDIDMIKNDSYESRGFLALTQRTKIAVLLGDEIFA